MVSASVNCVGKIGDQQMVYRKYSFIERIYIFRGMDIQKNAVTISSYQNVTGSSSNRYK